jgi:hypothetical protein
MPSHPIWSQIKSRLLSLEKQDLVNVIRDLYQLNTDNKVFLTTHLGFGDPETFMAPYKRTIQRVFNPERGFPSLTLSAARKALNDFKKASANQKAIADMMIYYVEQGVACTLNYGDIDAAFYSSLEGVFEDAIDLIKKMDSDELVEEFRPRLKRLVSSTSGIGWGFHDFLSDIYHSEYPPERSR